jgi:hypothetical protein
VRPDDGLTLCRSGSLSTPTEGLSFQKLLRGLGEMHDVLVRLCTAYRGAASND